MSTNRPQNGMYTYRQSIGGMQSDSKEGLEGRVSAQ